MRAMSCSQRLYMSQATLPLLPSAIMPAGQTDARTDMERVGNTAPGAAAAVLVVLLLRRACQAGRPARLFYVTALALLLLETAFIEQTWLHSTSCAVAAAAALYILVSGGVPPHLVSVPWCPTQMGSCHLHPNHPQPARQSQQSWCFSKGLLHQLRVHPCNQ